MAGNLARLSLDCWLGFGAMGGLGVMGRRFCKDLRMSLAWRRKRLGSDGSPTDG